MPRADDGGGAGGTAVRPSPLPDALPSRGTMPGAAGSFRAAREVGQRVRAEDAARRDGLGAAHRLAWRSGRPHRAFRRRGHRGPLRRVGGGPRGRHLHARSPSGRRHPPRGRADGGVGETARSAAKRPGRSTLRWDRSAGAGGWPQLRPEASGPKRTGGDAANGRDLDDGAVAPRKELSARDQRGHGGAAGAEAGGPAGALWRISPRWGKTRCAPSARRAIPRACGGHSPPPLRPRPEGPIRPEACAGWSSTPSPRR